MEVNCRLYLVIVGTTPSIPGTRPEKLHSIRAVIVAHTFFFFWGGGLYFTCSTMGPKTLFLFLRPLY